MPLNAGRLVASQVASTALQKHQRRSQERGFDDGKHARDPLFISSRSAFAAGTKAWKKAPPIPTEDGWTVHRRQAKKWPRSGLHEPARRSARLTVQRH